ncbi:MAG: AbrB/MazE/SpoVT family DNA-binding domain-containing protein [Patescibacteria group bacterium]
MSNNFTFLQIDEMQILKVSPKGQVTIPKKYRNLCNTGNFAFEVSGKTILLKPVEIKIVEDDTADFSALALSSFDFWDNKEDDIYDEFYKNVNL